MSRSYQGLSNPERMRLLSRQNTVTSTDIRALRSKPVHFQAHLSPTLKDGLTGLRQTSPNKTTNSISFVCAQTHQSTTDRQPRQYNSPAAATSRNQPAGCSHKEVVSSTASAWVKQRPSFTCGGFSFLHARSAPCTLLDSAAATATGCACGTQPLGSVTQTTGTFTYCAHYQKLLP
jgi:hypothetical protein